MSLELEDASKQKTILQSTTVIHDILCSTLLSHQSVPDEEESLVAKKVLVILIKQTINNQESHACLKIVDYSSISLTYILDPKLVKEENLPISSFPSALHNLSRVQDPFLEMWGVMEHMR